MNKYLGFTDESCWNQGRFRSISLVSVPISLYENLCNDIQKINEKYGCNEYKWSKNCNLNHNIDIFELFLTYSDSIRADIIIWDMEDSRHKGIKNRDDNENFARMYYHLLHNVLKQRWGNNISWDIYPDEKEGMDWSVLDNCLYWKSWSTEEGLLDEETFNNYYNIDIIKPKNSKSELIVQMADFFAGISVYSFVNYHKYPVWKDMNDPTLKLFEVFTEEEYNQVNNRDKFRLEVVDYIRNKAGQYKWSVSLESSMGLRTNNPVNPLNFWLYEPQHQRDKAPTKQR